MPHAKLPNNSCPRSKSTRLQCRSGLALSGTVRTLPAAGVAELDIAGIVRVLNDRRVEYVVIGGVAALAHDLPVPATIDIDVTPKRERRNLQRLAAAFDDLEAALLRADAGGTWFPREPVENWSRYETLHLVTKLGQLDIVFSPDGAPNGFSELVGRSTMLDLGIGNARARVISISAWEELKLASGREKDLEHLSLFYQFHAGSPD